MDRYYQSLFIDNIKLTQHKLTLNITGFFKYKKAQYFINYLIVLIN